MNRRYFAVLLISGLLPVVFFVEVSLVPPSLTAYDAVWLEAA